MPSNKILLIAALAAASSAHADVTVTTQTSGKAAFIDLGGEGVNQIKGTRMRTDSTFKGKTQSMIIDIDGRRFVSLDAKKKSATVTPLDTIADELQKVGVGTIDATLKKTAQTKQVAGFPCTVHDIHVSLPFSPTDPDATITKMKDGTTHLAYKAEHVVDLQSDLILAAEIRPTTHRDTQTLVDSVLKAEENLQAIGAEQSIEEVVADKGYHAADTLELCDSLGLRTYIPEPQRNSEWKWTERTPAHQRAVHGNRRRVKRAKGKQLQRRRSELCERSFAHVCETGGMRRTWLRGFIDVTKRYLIATAAHNLGRVLWKLLGVGKPRGMQGCGGAAWSFFALLGAPLHDVHLLRHFSASHTSGVAAPTLLMA